MTLAPNQTLLHYRLVEKIGEGGMGVVWKALDTTLDREVAIKFLPDAFAADPDRLARFEREAKLLASLNHPGIAAVYGLHEIAGDESIRFIAMELVPGEDLAERLAGGALETNIAIDVARQIADALEAAHEQGVIHRDLKPANVKLTPDGKVKVLDFGLAKAFAADASGGSSISLSLSPTVTSAGTMAGTLLGTAAYMSPEQARGHAVDRRADIWAFGAVLYEMLTGRSPFQGDTITDVLAAVVREDPDWSRLPADLPPRIVELLKRCTERDVRRRLRDIGEARILLEDPASREATPPGDAPAEAKERRPYGPLLSIAVVLAAALGAAATWWLSPTAGTVSHGPRVLALELDHSLAHGGLLGRAFSISRDGSRFAYTSMQGAQTSLHLRKLDEPTSRPLPGTDGAGDPFFSPDGRWIAFFASGQLKKVAISGGLPVTLCSAPGIPQGAHWGEDGHIVYATSIGTGLFRVSSEGGAPDAIESGVGRGVVAWPFLIPGGTEALITVDGPVDNQPGPHIATLDLESGALEVIAQGTGARLLSTGHLVYMAEETLLAMRFDAATAKPIGSAVSLRQPVGVWGGTLWMSVSDGGDLYYRPNDRTVTAQLVWVDRAGSVTPVIDRLGGFIGPRISPDGNRIAYVTDLSTQGDVWVHDLVRGSDSRISFEGFDTYPAWHPSGESLIWASDKNTGFDIYSRPVDGPGGEERLTESVEVEIPMDWSPDGKEILYYEVASSETQRDVKLLDRNGEVVDLVASTHNERAPSFSPDGRFYAYVSDESGRDEVYVRAYPDTGNRWMVSSAGGVEPRWGHDGTELFYRNAEAMMLVETETEHEFRAGRPQVLFRGPFALDNFANANYDVSADGQRFIMVQSKESGMVNVRVVLNWFAELERQFRDTDR